MRRDLKNKTVEKTKGKSVQGGKVKQNVLHGVVVRLNPEGEFGYLQEKNSQRQFIFKLNRVDELRKGKYIDSLKDVGLKIGTKVNFVTDDSDRVETVSLESSL